MRLITITTFAVTGGLVALAIANPVPNKKSYGMAIPLARHSPFLDSNKTIDLDAVTSHGISVREKILNSLDNYERNTGTMHPLAVKRSDSESGLGTRGAAIPLTAFQTNMWMGEISIGTPAKTFKVSIDTGSADTWVLQTGCAGISKDRDLWNPRSSRSAKYEGKSFWIEYGDETTVDGEQYSDHVTIAGFTAYPQTFGSAKLYTSLQTFEYPADGLLGLAFPSVSYFRADPLFESLVRQNRVINPIFSFKFSSPGAEMYIGGANSMLYNGDIAYTPVTQPAGLWQVSMDDVRVNGNIIFENVPAIFDAGASHIFGDWERVAELYRRVGGTLCEEHASFGFYSLPCDSFPKLGFTFGGKTFEILPELLILAEDREDSSICIGAVIAQRAPIEFWHIGITFLQGVYSVFDYSTLRVGFAKLA